MHRKTLKVSLAALACASLGFAGGALATKKVKKELVLVPSGKRDSQGVRAVGAGPC